MLDPEAADKLVAEVVAHPAGPWREQRQIGAALALYGKLAGLDAVTNLVVGDVHLAFDRSTHLGDLRTAVGFHARRVGGVVAVDVDDHRWPMVDRVRGALIWRAARYTDSSTLWPSLSATTSSSECSTGSTNRVVSRARRTRS